MSSSVCNVLSGGHRRGMDGLDPLDDGLFQGNIRKSLSFGQLRKESVLFKSHSHGRKSNVVVGIVSLRTTNVGASDMLGGVSHGDAV